MTPAIRMVLHAIIQLVEVGHKGTADRDVCALLTQIEDLIWAHLSLGTRSYGDQGEGSAT